MPLLSLANAIRSVPQLRSTIWRCRKTYQRLHRYLLVRRPIMEVSPALSNAISQSNPFAVGKMGSVELRGLTTYLRRLRAKARQTTQPDYSGYISETLFTNAGVFPNSPESFDQFASIYLDAVRRCDALGAWDVAGEAQVLSTYCPNALLFKISELEPFYSPNPWSACLRDLRVVVISPFTSTIREQYSKRTQLWQNPEVLPPFQLLTIRAPLSPGLVQPEYESWVDALNALKGEMDNLEYDVALIGAGAFSLPLAVHARRHGKVGVHLGGGLQLLFGIMGGRWENNKLFKMHVNDSWTRPSPAERPSRSSKVENACYW